MGFYMNKKLLILIGSGVIVICLIIAMKFIKGINTIEEALGIPSKNSTKIIAEDRTREGSVIFAYSKEKDTLYTSFIRKSLFGYENLYSGVAADITEASEKLKLSYDYFPSIKQSSLPIYFGVIGDDEIKEVKVKESENKEGWKSAKIIEAEGKRIWVIYMEGFKGSKFDIVGVSESGKEIVNITDNISPLKAEDKPIKSPYK